MDYTHKIAELCNGVSTCEVILTQQFIHKCSDEATYLFISYQCINRKFRDFGSEPRSFILPRLDSTVVDVCSQRRVTSSNGIHLISPSFPNEYPNNINCTCSVESSHSSTVIIDVEVRSPCLSLSLSTCIGCVSESLIQSSRQRSILVALGNHSFRCILSHQSKSIGSEVPNGRNAQSIRILASFARYEDEQRASMIDFVVPLGYDQCHADEFTLGSKCMKIISQKQSWKSAHEKCLSMKSNLIRLHDIIEERKLGYFFSTHAQQPQVPFWISNEKDKYDGEITQPVVCRGCLSKGQLFLPREGERVL